MCPPMIRTLCLRMCRTREDIHKGGDVCFITGKKGRDGYGFKTTQITLDKTINGTLKCEEHSSFE